MSELYVHDSTETPVELTIPDKPTAGVKTTEFWLIVAANIIATALAILGMVDAGWAIAIVGILNPLYAALRTYLKNSTVREAMRSIVMLLLLPLALCFTLGSCGLKMADLTYQEGAYDVKATFLPDGTKELVYTDRGTSRQFRLIQSEAGKVSVEARDPNTGLWVKYEGGGKSGLSLAFIPPTVEPTK